MNKLNFLIAILLIIGCSQQNETQYQIPKTVTITGTVLNFSPEKREVDFSVNRLGFSSDQYSSKLDSLGNFTMSFESYIPTDVWILYKMNFLVLTHPGDSIHVVFDGSQGKRSGILKTVNFSGDRAKINQDAAVFQEIYFSSTFYNDFDAKQNAIKNYETQVYTKYLDTMKQNSKALFDKFVSEVKPDKETKIWALTFVEEDYFDKLAFYPIDHKMSNQLPPGKWDVPLNYYEPLKTRLPIEDDMLISGYALSNFIQQYHVQYIFEHLIREKTIQKYITKTGRINIPIEMMDSLRVNSVIKYTNDDLLRQMELTFLFAQSLETNNVDLFEKYSYIIDKYITEPFLKEPLIEEYNKAKNWVTNPKITSDALLRNVANSSAYNIMDSIFVANAGKVIYLDCWATWCGPCVGEFPYSKNLMKQMKGKNVAFVFMCLDSNEKGWKATLSKFQLGGQHYLLTQKQSRDLRKALEIDGIPHYVLIDKKGNIVDKNALRPSSGKELINLIDKYL